MTTSLVSIQLGFGYEPTLETNVETIETVIYEDFKKLNLQNFKIWSKPPSPVDVKAKADPTTLILTGLASAGVFTALIESIRVWALRRESRRIKIRVEKMGQVVELDYSPAAISDEELEQFTKRILKLIENQ